MKRELFLLRHGKSDWPPEVEDFHRPLKNRGKRDAQRIGAWLQQQQIVPQVILSSPAERAIVSAEKCAKVLGIPVERIQQDARLYQASAEQLLGILKALPNNIRSIMLVGHNPGMEDFVTQFSNKAVVKFADGKVMPTATLARFAFLTPWRALGMKHSPLLQLIRPADLSERFPFPTDYGTEQRERPAYYYTQSSVIPYRIYRGRLEILLISSSKNKHWVIPKGIAEPGYSLHDSAAKEAREEAGIEGEVSNSAIGHYEYVKWGATCTVSVYPMKVTHQLSDDAWEENHRRRHWVSANNAIVLLRQEALTPIIRVLQRRLGKI